MKGHGTIAEAIRNYIGKAEIRQAWLAERCGWSRQRTSKLLSGEQKLTAEDMADICEALGVDYGFFCREARNEGGEEDVRQEAEDHGVN